MSWKLEHTRKFDRAYGNSIAADGLPNDRRVDELLDEGWEPIGISNIMARMPAEVDIWFKKEE